MTKRKMPPGRRSISQSTVVHGAGVNHFLTCLRHGPRGPDELRRNIDDAFEEKVEAGSGLTSTRVTLSLLQIFQIIVQLVEAAFPKRALLDHPAFRRLRAAAAPAERCVRGRSCASGPGRSSPERARCWVNEGKAMSNGRANSLTAAGPRLSRRSTARRVGSPSARKTQIELHRLVRHSPNRTRAQNLGQT